MTDQTEGTGGSRSAAGRGRDIEGANPPAHVKCTPNSRPVGEATGAFGSVANAEDEKGQLVGADRDAVRTEPSQGIDNRWQASDKTSAETQSAGKQTLFDAHSELRRMQNEHDRVFAGLGAAREKLESYQENVDRLNIEIAKTRGELEQRNLELDALRTELRILRALSDKLRDSMSRPGHATASKRRLTSRLTAALVMLASFSRYQRDTRALATRVEVIRNSGVFDAAWYLTQYPDVAAAGVDPLLHYLDHGAAEGRDPSPLFDSTWYRSTYADVVTQEMTPLEHFVSVGAARGYDPNPLFHTAWYVAQNHDADPEKVNPLRHYMDHAVEFGRNPNPLFDSAWYLNENPEVRASGENPLSHYIHSGIAELRDPHPLFDTEWYLEQYKDVVASGVDALEHYLTVGVFEGCRPGPDMPDRATHSRRKRLQLDAAAEWRDDRPPVGVRSVIGDDPASQQLPAPTDIMSWQMRLGKQQRGAAAKFTGQVGVFVHLFYEDLAEEIASSLLAVPFDFKAYVSTNNNAKKTAIEAAFRRCGLDPVVKVLPNRGWDIAPFLLGFAEEIRSHEICLKLHGKRSGHSSGRFGARWRGYLLSGLLGDRRNVASIVESFVAHPELGVLMLPHWRGIAPRVNIIGMNYRPMQALLGRAGLSISPDQWIEFPSGSMFWFRSAALAPLLDLGLTWVDFYGCRARNVDATIAHGIERSILIFAAKAGFKWAFLPKRWIQRTWAAQRRWGALRALARAGARRP